MNKLSGYKEFTLASGRVIELKFSNATTEIFAGLMNLKTLKEVDEALTLPADVPELDEAGNPVLDEQGGPVMRAVPLPISYMTALRRFIYAAALYAARVQNKPTDFNEWEVQEWIDEIGAQSFLTVVDQPETEPKKNEAPTQEVPANP